MNAFFLETLHPTGWRRTAEVYWRQCDAQEAGEKAMHRNKARAIRILVATISPKAILEIEAPPLTTKSRSIANSRESMPA